MGYLAAHFGFNFNLLPNMVCDIQHYFRLAIYTTDLPLCPAGNAPYSWGTPCGGPVCIYHMSRWYQTGSMQRNELTKAEQRTWVYKLVCMCAWVWRTRTFYNYWKKRSWKEAEGFKMILLAKCFPVGGKKKRQGWRQSLSCLPVTNLGLQNKAKIL